MRHAEKRKVLTVQQPFASLIADGKKCIEHRSWRTHYRGPLVIHAGKGIDREECRRRGYDADALPRGVTLCTVELYDCYERTNGEFGWRLRNPRKIKPVKMRGSLGLWHA